MMQTNVTLEFVRLEVSDYALQQRIAFFLQLNHKGRRELFAKINHRNHSQQSQPQLDSHKNAEIALWVQALCQNTCNVRALHYFLALHPGLFAMAALEAHQRRRQQQLLHDSFTSGVDCFDPDGSDGWLYR